MKGRAAGAHAVMGRRSGSASLFERRNSLASHQTQHPLGAHGKADMILYA